MTMEQLSYAYVTEEGKNNMWIPRQELAGDNSRTGFFFQVHLECRNHYQGHARLKLMLLFVSSFAHTGSSVCQNSFPQFFFLWHRAS